MTIIKEMTQDERRLLFDTFDSMYNALHEKAKSTQNTDEVFSIMHRKEALEIVDLLRGAGIKTTYNNLTNMNNHFLVKVLNYNNYFKLPKKFKNDIKKLKLIL
jgi:hypothetical protein